jgi:Ni,Fe-hydrogenase III large subunit/Ni,Fe-hydrogenase III component G
MLKDQLKDWCKIGEEQISAPYPDELSLRVERQDFKQICLVLHSKLRSPAMMLFASDLRPKSGGFELICVFLSAQNRKWVSIKTMLEADHPKFESLSKELYSASLFERQIKEMFGIHPQGNPDLRSLHLHEEVWPQAAYPMRKDFQPGPAAAAFPGSATHIIPSPEYPFLKVEGEGVFEVPVGPVHAGVIGPGHFRFSVAGEPIINLELRLGWTHRGAEKLFESKTIEQALRLSECVSGDQAFSYSLSFTRAIEKIQGISVTRDTELARSLLLELERMYNHVTGIAGIALDVGFSLPAMFAQEIKERILRLNRSLTGHRYLKNINFVGGIGLELDSDKKNLLAGELSILEKDMLKLRSMLLSSVSFLDRVDSTGVLRKKTAHDLGVTGLVARASGINLDLRGLFEPVYAESGFKVRLQEKGDVLARLNLRLEEFEDSLGLVREFAEKISTPAAQPSGRPTITKAGSALGYAESWRGPVLFWVELDEKGAISRCKIVDPSFKNWPALSFAVLDNIIPDFPVCNKSFDLSYSGNDL